MTALARLLLLYALLPAPVFAVDEIHLQLGSLSTAFFTTKAIDLAYAPQQSAHPGLTVRVNTLSSPYFEQVLDASLYCADARYSEQIIDCANGHLELNGPQAETVKARFNLRINLIEKSSQLRLDALTREGRIRIAVNAVKDSGWDADISIDSLELSIFSPLLQALAGIFKGDALASGKLSGQAHLRGGVGGLDKLTLNTRITGLSIVGESTLEKVDFQLLADISRQKNIWSFRSVLDYLAGEMYIQPHLRILGAEPGFYLAASAEPVTFRIAGNWAPPQHLVDIREWSYTHPGILQLQGSAGIKLGEEPLLSELVLNATIPDLDKAYPIYIQPILLETNFSDLDLTGALEVSLAWRQAKLEKLDLLLDKVFIDDKGNRFSISGLDSHLLLDSDLPATQSTLAWSGLSFYRLDFGAGDIVFESVGRDISVLRWQDVAILDGGINIQEFTVHNLATADFEVDIGGELSPISMQALTQALGWTVFPGKLSGKISGLKITRNNLQLTGDISVKLFGGKLTIHKLQVKDLFSSYSVLTTDMRIDRLDLEQLTDVFTFGKIEGSLSGRVDKLRLEDWQPAYFEAGFATPEDDEKPHRISQKALENLNELGGGLSGTLSRGFLRFLPEYSYGRLGLSCRLVNGICELGGVEEKGDSFSILTRGGLLPPWVEVKGAGRSIKWDDLIGGLKQIAAGEVTIE